MLPWALDLPCGACVTLPKEGLRTRAARRPQEGRITTGPPKGLRRGTPSRGKTPTRCDVASCRSGPRATCAPKSARCALRQDAPKGGATSDRRTPESPHRAPRERGGGDAVADDTVRCRSNGCRSSPARRPSPSPDGNRTGNPHPELPKQNRVRSEEPNRNPEGPWTVARLESRTPAPPKRKPIASCRRSSPKRDPG
jgi:hypothetical protein